MRDLAKALGRLVASTLTATSHAGDPDLEKAELAKWQANSEEAHALIATLNRRGDVYRNALGVLTESGNAVLRASMNTEYLSFLETMRVHHRLFPIDAFNLEADDVDPDG